MAKYISNTTTSIRNKLGGVVYSDGRTARTMRAMAAPRRSPSSLPTGQNLVTLSAIDYWASMPGHVASYWELFAAWWYPERVDGLPVYHDYYTLFQQCFMNAYLLGQPMPEDFPDPNPPPPQTPLTTLMIEEPGGLALIPFASDGHAMTAPCLFYITRMRNGMYSKPLTTGGTFIGASLSGSSIFVTDEVLAAYGTLIYSGDFVCIRTVTLYRHWWASYGTNAAVSQVL